MSASEAPAKPGRVLIVAGSDSGGGAGIQADIKTVTALGQYAMTAVTAITVQNTLGVHGVTPLAPDLIEAQMRACLSDLGADAVKTGMLHDAGAIGAVAAALADLGRGIPLVLDPVMVAKGGAKLIDDTAIEALKRDLFPLAALITPNAPEAAALAGGAPVETLDDLIRTGRMLRTLGPAAVLMKGGHLPGARLFDVLVTEAGETVFESARIETRHTHGTGCTLASAIAAGLAAGLELGEAVRRARDYVREAIRTAPGFGGGHGPLNHMHTVPRWN